MQYRRDIVEQARAEIGNQYALVNVVAKRANQLSRGAEPLVVDGGINLEKPVITALKEIAAGEVTVKPQLTIVGKHTASRKVKVDGALSDSIDDVA